MWTPPRSHEARVWCPCAHVHAMRLQLTSETSLLLLVKSALVVFVSIVLVFRSTAAIHIQPHLLMANGVMIAAMRREMPHEEANTTDTTMSVISLEMLEMFVLVAVKDIKVSTHIGYHVQRLTQRWMRRMCTVRSAVFHFHYCAGDSAV